ncbi:ubiquitin-conjugating enzyme/RWD-like protein [Entophlyctis helioformis]|nr:ubiquitin-conjugating enzyme/RWD-like protein [Entophlyctis helioformis]
MAGVFAKRLSKELRDLQARPPAGISIRDLPDIDSLACWNIRIEGAPGTLFQGEVFNLQVRCRLLFLQNYPLESPEVVFTGPNIPAHPHIYTNGHICLSILYDQWSPALTVSSVCLSILSMLSSCTRKGLPPGNDAYVASARKSPKDTLWAFHDDSV